MNCPNCNQQIPDNTNTCPRCGASLLQAVPQYPNTQPTYPQTPQPVAPKANKVPVVPIVIAVVILAAIIGVIIYVNSQQEERWVDEIIFSKDELPNKNDSTPKDEDSEVNDNLRPAFGASYTENDDFFMGIEDVYTITDKGTTITGYIERGTINVNDEVEIISKDKIIKTKVTSIQKFKEEVESLKQPDYASISLENVSREDVSRGMVLAKSGTFTTAKKVEANINLVSTDAGGRHTPIFEGYNPKIWFYIPSVQGRFEFLDGQDKIEPGAEDVNVSIDLEKTMPMAVGLEFAIQENGKVVGTGIVTKIY